MCIRDRKTSRLLSIVWEAHPGLRGKVRTACSLAGLAPALFLAFYTGMLLRAAPGVPFWHSALLPCLFVVSALGAGTNAVTALVVLTGGARKAVSYTHLDVYKRQVAYRFERGRLRFVSLSCMHCAQPACLAACPAGAIGKRADGIVVVDQGRCIGCRYCHEACPFGTPHYTPQGMDKYDGCLGAGVEPGREPYCVQACPADALHFGELEEMRPQAEAADATDLLEAPTGPSFFLT